MKRAEHQPQTLDLGIYAGIFIKTWTVPDRGTMMPQHSHVWPHISYIVSGAVRVWRDDEELGDFVGPCPFKIPALAKHRFLTLSDNVVILCIHNADHTDEAGEPSIAAEYHIVTED
jgi:quercetin dioxygenase-like cupin family protein